MAASLYEAFVPRKSARGETSAVRPPGRAAAPRPAPGRSAAGAWPFPARFPAPSAPDAADGTARVPCGPGNLQARRSSSSRSYRSTARPAAARRVDQQRQVREGRHAAAERLEHLDLRAGVGDVVLAADHVRDGEVDVVDHRGEAVEVRAVGRISTGSRRPAASTCWAPRTRSSQRTSLDSSSKRQCGLRPSASSCRRADARHLAGAHGEVHPGRDRQVGAGHQGRRGPGRITRRHRPPRLPRRSRGGATAPWR